MSAIWIWPSKTFSEFHVCRDFHFIRLLNQRRHSASLIPSQQIESEMEMPLLVERATVIPFTQCRRTVACLGPTFGKAEEDSEGQAIVMGEAGRYVAGYISGGTLVLLDHIKHGCVELARDAAEEFTRAACE
jgi:hypothetical protein